MERKQKKIQCIKCGNTDQTKDMCHDYCDFYDPKTELIISIMTFFVAAVFIIFFMGLGALMSYAFA